MPSRLGVLFLPVLLLGWFPLLSAAEEGSEEASLPAAPERQAISLPGGEGEKTLELTAGTGSVFGKDELYLTNYVDARYGPLRMQADTIRYVIATKKLHAEGNVIVDNGDTRITAKRVDYDLGTETGIFYEARGFAEPSFFFEAAEVRKVDADRYVILDAKFTTCTQPVPYWSFKVARGTIHLDNYAYLHHVSFRLEKVPAFYSPYLVWPIKKDRATGLLFPEFGFSRSRGFVLSNAFYWAMRRNMDATFFIDYYALAGVGEGLEYRYVPSENGKGILSAAFIRDQVTDQDRYFVNHNHRQELPNDFRLVATFNEVSDSDYFLDFQRDLRLATNPVALSNIYLSRSWSSYAFNFRAERRRQFVTLFGGAEPEEATLTNLILPKLELLGSRRQLGNSPVYFSFNTSLDHFDKETTSFATRYQRFDLFPSFSVPLKLASWLDINPSLGLRDTYYSKRGVDVGADGIPGTGDEGEGNRIIDEQGEILEEDFLRKILQGSVEIIGPKLSRVFLTPDSEFSPAYKHTWEPTLFYLYQSKVDDPLQVIQFDEKDVIRGNQNSLAYALTTRLFAKRPGVSSEPDQNPTGLSLPESLNEPYDEGQTLPAPVVPTKQEEVSLSPVEIASFQISQSYSFVGPQSFRRECGENCVPNPDPQGEPICTVTCVEAETSQASPISLNLRYNPTLHASLDLRGTYDFLNSAFSRGTLSANFKNPRRGFVDLSWFFQNGLDALSVDTNQVSLLTESNFVNRKLILGFQGNYDVTKRELRDQRYKIGYNTQCCGFTFEILDRNFQGSDQQEFRLVVNLRGIGNVIDVNSGSSVIPAVPINF